MKNRFKVLGVALLLAGAQAQTKVQSGPLYGELGYAPVKISFAGYSITPKVLRGMLGYEVNPNLAVEGMLGLGVSDGSTTVSGVRVTGEVDHMIGLYLKPKVTVTPELELFARAGIVRNKVTASVPAAVWTGSDTQSDVSYGLGLAYSINKTTSLVVDCMSYYSKDGVKGNGVTVGVGFKF